MTERVDIGDWCTLYHADSTEILDTLKAHAPDAVIMDPPYGIGLHNAGYNSAGSVNGAIERPERRRGNYRLHGDKEGPDLAPWFPFPKVLFWGADHLRSQIPPGGRFLSWDKLAGMTHQDVFADVEYAWHSEKRKAMMISYKWKGLACAKAREDDYGKRSHPTQKPCAVMEWCIEQCRLEPGATILDPYMGSGTTAIAAFKRKMKFVGVEIDRRWFDVAVERINRQTADGPLFEAAPLRSSHDAGRIGENR